MEENLKNLEQGFRTLIIEQCKFCKFDKYLEENPDFEFPKITPELLGQENTKHVAIPGLFGGFSYFLEEKNGMPVLYCEQSSRMDYSSDDYSYFEVAENNSRMLEGEERAAIQKKFQSSRDELIKNMYGKN